MNVKKIAAIYLALTLAATSTVYASEIKPSKDNKLKEESKIEMKLHKPKERYNSGLYKAAKEMGITKEELKAAKEAGKNFFELAKEKGYTEQQVKDIMLKNKYEFIDKTVEKEKITKEKAEELKRKMKEKISNWDGNFKKHKDMEKKHEKQ